MTLQEKHSWVREVEQLLLPYVDKPAQYLGNEYNSVEKNWEELEATMAFLFPDTYEIGMSHLGLRVLYQVVNADPRFVLERSFAPQTDMEALMRSHGVPLFTWENYHSVGDFDVVGVTLQYEMSYTNILNMLDLAGIPLWAKDRLAQPEVPLVIAGGPCAYNPEPLADFFDLFVLGEGEEVTLELLALWSEIKKQNGPDNTGNKKEFLQRAAEVGGVYVPAFYQPQYDGGKFTGLLPQPGAPEKVTKRIIKDFDKVDFPTKPIMPFTQIIHDRVVLEVMRGCNRGCRFCQAGVIYRPVREKSVETLVRQAAEAVQTSGYDEIGMVSLSTADYSCVEPLIDALMANHKKDGVSVSLPSLRVDAFSVDLAKKVQQVRKSGLTFAPEAGTQRLRDVINKGVRDEDIIAAVTSALENGWQTIKLYFMAGLPFETDEDLDGIYDIAQRVVGISRELNRGKKSRPVNITVSVAFFVPKPHTAFQWFGQVEREKLLAKREYLYQKFRNLKQARLVCHGVDLSFLEAVFSRGDRRLAPALYRAWQLGCKFDGWQEHFKYNQWLQAFAECGIDPEAYASRSFELEDALPWDRIDVGVSKKWLWREWQKAEAATVTPDCRKDKCSGCGVCAALQCENQYQQPNGAAEGAGQA